MGISFIIPDIGIMSNKRLSDNLAVFTGELLEILLALTWTESTKSNKILISSDSSNALISIKNLQSDIRQDIILEILQTIVRIKKAGTVLQFIWVPAH